MSQQQRYVLKEILGKGGMGAVYRAYDNETRRDVTLKTLLDVQDRAMLDLFYRECQVLASLNHPNIVDIYDVGEMEFDGDKRPYFVMPLLSGCTLDKLIAEASHRLSSDAVVDMLTQASRGLHAAHERGLVHRDIKPSNLFIMDDDSVKIIDFGVAHLADGRTSTTLKGTLHYMAPEQLMMQKPTALSDLFSLAVVSYQAFTRRRPFEGATADETLQAIMNRIPPSASDINPAVNRAIGQVVHKAMAKQPYHRFANLREYSDCLQQALRGDPLDIFDESKILPRVERARKAVAASEFDFANEVLAGLEAEGYLHPDMAGLRRQVDDAVRQRAISQRLSTARRFLDEEEYQLAITKAQELLQIDPGNAEALALKSEIETRRSAEQVKRWMTLADQHAANHSYGHARQALENVLALRPEDTMARRQLNLVVEREQDYIRLRKEKEGVYRSALESWQRGEVTSALGDIERVLELDKQAPESTTDRAASYQQFYNQVRSEHDLLQSWYNETRRLMNERDFKGALALCEQGLAKHPQHALFQALKVDIEQQARQDQSAFVARIDRDVEQEPDLERRISILKQALSERPGEAHFERELKLIESKRDLVNSIVAKARGHEEKAQFQEAYSQWEMLLSIYPIYPGLEFELERLAQRRDQTVRSTAKRDWVRRVDQAMDAGDFRQALDHLAAASAEFPVDQEWIALEKVARQGADRLASAEHSLSTGLARCESGQVDAGIEALRQALNAGAGLRIYAVVIDVLIKQARAYLDRDWAPAEKLIREAAMHEPSNPAVKSMQSLLADRRQAEFVEQCLVEARQLQAARQVDDALTAVARGLAAYPQDQRLQQLRVALEKTRAASTTTGGRNDADTDPKGGAIGVTITATPSPKPPPPPPPPAIVPPPPAALPSGKTPMADDGATLMFPGVTSVFQAPPPAPPSAAPPKQVAAPPLAPPAADKKENQKKPLPTDVQPTVQMAAVKGPLPPPAPPAPPPPPSSGQPTVKIPVPPPAPPPAAAKPNTLMYAGLGVAVALLAGLGFFLMSGSKPVEQAKPVEPPPASAPQDPGPAPAAATPAETAPADPAAPAVARGSVLLAVNEPGFTLTLDGRPIMGFRPTANPNEYLIPNLNPGRRKFAVFKNGFIAEPAVGEVAVVGGKQAALKLNLVPLGPTRWTVQGARPGTEVVLLAAGGRSLGRADAQGNLSGADLPDGVHEVELRLKGYNKRTARIEIRPGKDFVLSGGDVRLDRIEFVLDLSKVEPRNASLAIDHTRFELKYDGPNPVRPMPAQIGLPPGFYNLTFSAPGYDPETISVDLKFPLAPVVKLKKR